MNEERSLEHETKRERAARPRPSGSFAQPAVAASKKTELLVSAAASLKDSLAEIEKGYEASHPAINLVFNLGSSGTLQKQIEQGAPAGIIPGVHKPILYPAGIVKDTKHPKEAAAFYSYLQGNEADAIFAKYGFKLP